MSVRLICDFYQCCFSKVHRTSVGKKTLCTKRSQLRMRIEKDSGEATVHQFYLCRSRQNGFFSRVTFCTNILLSKFYVFNLFTGQTTVRKHFTCIYFSLRFITTNFHQGHQIFMARNIYEFVVSIYHFFFSPHVLNVFLIKL